ncbi:MAG: hypothetical protein FJX57_12380 [Alphaproteobacteria bacterium]|nr:hypothetical protein [Alphaproteobacteria bacterium]
MQPSPPNAYIVEFARRLPLPTFSTMRPFAQAGGLVSYGASIAGLRPALRQMIRHLRPCPLAVAASRRPPKSLARPDRDAATITDSDRPLTIPRHPDRPDTDRSPAASAPADADTAACGRFRMSIVLTCRAERSTLRDLQRGDRPADVFKRYGVL